MSGRAASTDLHVQAAQRYRDAFEAFAGNGAGAVPAWLQERRVRAFEQFSEAGFPHGRLEAWRFTDVKPLVRTEFGLAPAAQGVTANDVEPRIVALPSQRVAVFVNGRFAPEVSSVGTLPDGVRFGSLCQALASDADLLEPYLGRYADTSDRPFAALATAFVHDGAFLYVPKEVEIAEPFQVLFLVQPSADPVVVHPRNLFIVERGAKAMVVESYAALGAGTYWSNAVTEAIVGDNASLDAYRLQRDGAEAYHTATTHSHQGRDSRASLITATVGAALSRHDIHAVLDGEGADCTLDGLGLQRARQHTDWHTTLEHAKPHGTSWEYFNGIFDDRAHGVFTGRIIVRPGAQKTDSKQTNNNLLLSERARADSQPQLEIYADDVKCTHGATLGPIDPDHLFYLEARGLTPAEARAMLTYGFAWEVLNNVAHVPLRAALDRIVQDWLAETADVKAAAG